MSQRTMAGQAVSIWVLVRRQVATGTTVNTDTFDKRTFNLGYF